MLGKFNRLLSFSFAAILFFAVVLPEVAVADTRTELGGVDLETATDLIKETDKVTNFIDEYFEENGLYDIDFENLTEKEIDDYFNQLINSVEYTSFENKVSAMSQVQANKLIETDTPTAYAVPVAFIPIGLVALRLLVTQGSKAAIAYLKRATKKLTKQYKISFPNSTKQLILIQDKKSGKRIFSLDKHNVKMVHKKTNKGYPGSVSVWHFHAAPNTSQHLMLCSSVPKNYKVQQGKCYF